MQVMWPGRDFSTGAPLSFSRARGGGTVRQLPESGISLRPRGGAQHIDRVATGVPLIELLCFLNAEQRGNTQARSAKRKPAEAPQSSSGQGKILVETLVVPAVGDGKKKSRERRLTATHPTVYHQTDEPTEMPAGCRDKVQTLPETTLTALTASDSTWQHGDNSLGGL